jgi:hypothetical protein
VADLAEARRDYDVLQVEYEKILISNQQSGVRFVLTNHKTMFCFRSSYLVPIAREMRSLISHLQAQCKLHSLEASRCKKRCKELEEELVKAKAKQEATTTMNINGFSTQMSMITSEPISAGSMSNHQEESPSSKEEGASSMNPFSTPALPVVKVEAVQKEEPTEGVSYFLSLDSIRFIYLLSRCV